MQKFIFINLFINLFASLGRNIFSTHDTLHLFNIVEYTTAIFFVIEFIARYATIGYDKRYKGIFGKIRFTFTPLILIDIIAIVPYIIGISDTNLLLARIVRFLKFTKILKLIRVRDVAKNFFSIVSFSTAPLFVQIVVLFILSSIFIFLFSHVYSDENTSLMIFLDPPSLAETKSATAMFFGTIELIIGLLIGGALISILTKTLSDITSNIKNGYHQYRNLSHIIIIHHNKKLDFILDEINNYYHKIEQVKDVVLFLPEVSNLEKLRQDSKKYLNINILFFTGEIFNWNSYSRLNINYAEKLLVLQQDDIKENITKNVKIVKYILSHNNFINSSLEFVIDTNNSKVMQPVYKQVFHQYTNLYALVWRNSVIQSFLKRSVIEADYFKVYLNLLSFNGYEFYRLEAKDVFEKSIIFEEAYRQFNDGILIGIRKEGKLFLNPAKDTNINADDKLITILENKYAYSLDTYSKSSIQHNKLPKPSLKMSRSICIVGNYDDINEAHIVEFLSYESRKKLTHVVVDDNDYIKQEIWDKIINKNYDVIILNMEDDYEFILTMYLRNTYSSKKHFLKSIINIIHDSVHAKLLEDKHNNIILSDMLVGQYTVQTMFNHGIVDIFDEITHAYGSEFYILEKHLYQELYTMCYQEVRITLFNNKMIYIGTIKGNDFIMNDKDIRGTDKIVVLAHGK